MNLKVEVVTKICLIFFIFQTYESMEQHLETPPTLEQWNHTNLPCLLFLFNENFSKNL